MKNVFRVSLAENHYSMKNLYLKVDTYFAALIASVELYQKIQIALVMLYTFK